MSELPGDLVEEILCRVPAKNLKGLRSTCKRWNSLFKDDRRFATKHSDKAAKQFMVLIFTWQIKICPLRVNFHGMIPSLEVESELSLFDRHSNNSAQFDISHVFHCDGLLLCTSEDESRIVVWNPCTGQTKWIDTIKRHKKGRIFVLGYCQDKKSCVKSYKILSLYSYGSKDSEIYEFSSDSWRILDYDIAPGLIIAYPTHIVSFKGNAYWFASDQPCIYLLRFDFSTEKSEPVPLPYQCPRYRVHLLSVVREEKLSVLLQRNKTSKTEVWVTNKIGEIKAVSWSKVLALDLSPDFHTFLQRFLLDEEKKVVVCWETWIFYEDVLYMVGEDNKVTHVDFGVDTLDYCWPVILISYVPSLVQIERAKGKRKRGDYN